MLEKVNQDKKPYLIEPATISPLQHDSAVVAGTFMG